MKIVILILSSGDGIGEEMTLCGTDYSIPTDPDWSIHLNPD